MPGPGEKGYPEALLWMHRIRMDNKVLLDRINAVESHQHAVDGVDQTRHKTLKRRLSDLNQS